MTSNSLATTALSITLGLFFIFIGLVKVFPNINEDIYRDWKNEFGRYNKVFPLVSLTKWRPFARNWRLAIALNEIICGSMLVLLPRRFKNLANLILLAEMAGALYTHLALDDKFDRMALSLIFGMLLLCRLIIDYQADNQEQLEPINESPLEKELDEVDLVAKKESRLSSIYRDKEEKKIK